VSALLGVVALAAAFAANAQNWPARPVKMIVSFAPGGGADIIARTLAPLLSEALGQSFIVENRVGGGGVIGTEAVVRSPADGLTLLVSGKSEITLLPNLLASPAYDAERDLAPVMLVAAVPTVLAVHSSVPANNLRELVSAARAAPVPFGTVGHGSLMHIAMEILNAKVQGQFVHVPYKGGAPAVVDLVGGQIGVAVVNTPPLMTHIKSKKVRPLAVFQDERSALLPDVPTVKEALGLDEVSAPAWFAIFAPAKTPVAVLSRLEAEVARALQNPEIRNRLEQAGFEVVGLRRAAFAELIHKESAYYRDAIKRFNIRPD
jgi:tripartite-type tricarboxylate transporter receptor subunit TctC